MSSSMKKAMGIAKGAGAKGSMGGRLGIVKKQPGMGGDLRSRLGGGRGQQMQQMTFVANNMPQQQQQQQSRADAEDSWGHDMFYKSGYASSFLPHFTHVSPHTLTHSSFWGPLIRLSGDP